MNKLSFLACTCCFCLLGFHAISQNTTWVFKPYHENDIYYDMISEEKSYNDSIFHLSIPFELPMPENSRFKKSNGKWYLTSDTTNAWQLFFDGDKQVNSSWCLFKPNYMSAVVWQPTTCFDSASIIYCFAFKPFHDMDNPIIEDDGSETYYVENDITIYYFTEKDGIIGFQLKTIPQELFYREDKTYLKECFRSNTVFPTLPE